MQGRERKIQEAVIILFFTDDNQGREKQSKVESLVWYPDPLKSDIDLMGVMKKAESISLERIRALLNSLCS